MSLVELNEDEQEGIADIVDGTMGLMMQDIGWDDGQAQYWIGILDKLGERGKIYAEAWKDKRKEALQ